jgi:riboflavin-specific deaminase-like protein
MRLPTRTPAPPPDADRVRDDGWRLAQAAAGGAERAAAAGAGTAWALGEDQALTPVLFGDPTAVLAWRAGCGWESLLAQTDPRCALLDLYLPICSATRPNLMVVGHLGQSLDGFIATHEGESQWVTGEENILHLHRLRALCDAVVVGAGTVAADDPQLTTRRVAGPNPLRVVLDPTRRLGTHHRVFSDRAAETLYVCAQSLIEPGEDRVGSAAILGVDETLADGTVPQLLRHLHARGCTRVFVEGGGVTVSMFLEANRLDRLHMTIAPLFIGDGRPAIRLEPRASLGDCHRPRYRVFRMGADMLFDCEFGTSGETSTPGRLWPPVSRVI